MTMGSDELMGLQIFELSESPNHIAALTHGGVEYSWHMHMPVLVIHSNLLRM